MPTLKALQGFTLLWGQPAYRHIDSHVRILVTAILGQGREHFCGRITTGTSDKVAWLECDSIHVRRGYRVARIAIVTYPYSLTIHLVLLVGITGDVARIDRDSHTADVLDERHIATARTETCSYSRRDFVRAGHTAVVRMVLIQHLLRWLDSVWPLGDDGRAEVGVIDERVVLCVDALVVGSTINDDRPRVYQSCDSSVRNPGRDKSPGVGILSAVGSRVGVGTEGSDCSLEAV